MRDTNITIAVLHHYTHTQLRARLRLRADTLCRALLLHLPPACNFEWALGGYFVWVQLPPGMSAAKLQQRCADTVTFLPGPLATVAGALPSTTAASGAAPEACDSCLRLCFAKASLPELEEGARRLAAAINAAAVNAVAIHALFGNKSAAVVSAVGAATTKSTAVADSSASGSTATAATGTTGTGTTATAGSSGAASGSTAAAGAPAAGIKGLGDGVAAAAAVDHLQEEEEEDSSDMTQWHDCATTTDEQSADSTAVTAGADGAVAARASTPTPAATTAAATGTATTAGASGSGAAEGVSKQHLPKPSLTLGILLDTVHTAPTADLAAAAVVAAVKSGSPKSGSSNAYASPSSAAVKTTRYTTEATPARSPRSIGKREPYVPSPGRMAKYWMHEVPDTADTSTATTVDASAGSAAEGVPKQHSHKPSRALDILPDTVHTAPTADSAVAAAVAAAAVKSGSPKSGSSSVYASPSSAAVRTTRFITDASPARSPRSIGKREPYVPSPDRLTKYWMHEVLDTADTGTIGTSTEAAVAAAAGGNDAAAREYIRVGNHRAVGSPPQSPQRNMGRSYYGTPCGSPLREGPRALHIGDAREEGEIHVLLNLMSRQMRAEVRAGRVGVAPNLPAPAPAPPASPK
jgi:hypothetical protein